jgi:hypothetical protein
VPEELTSVHILHVAISYICPATGRPATTYVMRHFRESGVPFWAWFCPSCQADHFEEVP